MSTSSSPDHLVDRRRLQRKLSFWRVAAFLFLIVLIGAVGLRLSGIAGPIGLTPHIARLTIRGFISGDRGTLKLIDQIGRSQARGVILSIESPGGTTTGAEKLYDAIRRLSAKKPVVAVIDTMAASGAYITALAADRIVAHGNSLVGSIGVLIQYPNIAKLLDTIGVKIDAVKSSPLKAEPSGYEPTSPQVRQVLASLVDDSYVWFKELVKKRRHMSDAELAVVDDGRVFTGRQALGVKLIDQIGGQREAIAWLEHAKGVPVGLPVRDWKGSISLERLGILGYSARIAQAFGFTGVAEAFDRAETYRKMHLLDGLLSIWQADRVE